MPTATLCMPGCPPRHVCAAERRLLLTYLLTHAPAQLRHRHPTLRPAPDQTSFVDQTCHLTYERTTTTPHMLAGDGPGRVVLVPFPNAAAALLLLFNTFPFTNLCSIRRA